MEEIYLKDLCKYYLKHLYLIIIVVFLLVIFGEYKLKKVVPVYESTTKITMSNIKKDISNKKEITDLELFQNYRNLVITADFIKPIIDNNKLKMTVDSAISNIVLIQEEGTNIFDIKYSNTDRFLAQKYNEKLSNSFVAALRKNKITSAKIIQNTTTSNKPINIDYNKKRITYIVAGLLLGCVIVFIKYYFDDKIESPDNLNNYNLLGIIPKNKKIYKDRISIIKSKLLLDNKKTNVVLFTSINKTDELSIFIKDLLHECSKNNKVLYINADLRNNITKNRGYSDLVNNYNNKTKIDDYITNNGNLSIIENGNYTNDIDNILSNKNNNKIIDLLKEKFDYIFIKTSELKDKSDPLILSKLADKVIVMVNENVTKYKELEEANISFKQIDESIDGIVYSKIKK